MRVKCIENKVSILPKILHEFFGDNLNANLILNESYLVYALKEDCGYIWFCLLEKENSRPRWYPEHFFSVEDQHLSKYWIFNFYLDWQKIKSPLLAFPEWANDIDFYAGLFDDNEEAWEILKKYLKLMDLEFPNPNITETAQIGDDQWLICPLCIDAWENQTIDALVVCSKCKTTLNNPRYKNDFFPISL
jgi:hypothetical protein